MRQCVECELAFGNGRAYWMTNRIAVKKCIWLGVLFLLLVCTCVLCRQVEAANFGGIPIVSREELEELTFGMQYIEEPLEAGRFLTLENQELPYDQENHTFYVSQSVEKDDFMSSFSMAAEGCRFFIEKSDIVNDVEEAMQLGYAYQLWIIEDSAYTVCNIIITGAPVISITTSDRMGSEYGEGEMALFDPDDRTVNGLSIKTSSAFVKKNFNSQTYSIKLMKKDYIEEKKLSLLDAGKSNTWKLYKVSPNDQSCLRAKLAADVWNEMNAGTGLVRPYEFVEVVENHSYKGLYLLAPKWSKSLLGLSDEDCVIKSEELSAEEREDIMQSLSNEALGRYYLFLQAVYAYKNVEDNCIFVGKKVSDANVEYVIIPDRLEYAFGGFDNSLNYLTWRQDDTVYMTINLSDLVGDSSRQAGEFVQMCREEWQRLRADCLSTGHLSELLASYKDYMVESGLAKRCVNGDAFGYYYDLLEQYVTDRMLWIDEYFADMVD